MLKYYEKNSKHKVVIFIKDVSLIEIDFSLAQILCNLDDFVPAMLNSTYIPSKKSKVEAYS